MRPEIDSLREANHNLKGQVKSLAESALDLSAILDARRKELAEWKARALAAEEATIAAQRQGCALVEKARVEAYQSGYNDGYQICRMDFNEDEPDEESEEM